MFSRLPMWCVCVCLSACATTPVQPPDDSVPASADAVSKRSFPASCSLHPEAQKLLPTLQVGQSLMSHETTMADASSHTVAVDSFVGWFPHLEEQKLRTLLVTPVTQGKTGEALGALVASEGLKIDEFGVIDRFLWVTLDCTETPARMQMEPLKLAEHDAVQFRGSEVVTLPSGERLTFVRMMFSLPDIMEFRLVSWSTRLDASGQPHVIEWTEDLASQFNFNGTSSRMDAFAGMGWFPLVGSTRQVLLSLRGISGPDDEEEGGWVEFIALRAFSSLDPPEYAVKPARDSFLWAWLVRGDRPKECGKTLHCNSLHGEPFGSFPWHGTPPYDWIVGAWSTPNEAAASLRAAGEEPERGVLMPTFSLEDGEMYDEENPIVFPKGVKIIYRLPYETPQEESSK